MSIGEPESWLQEKDNLKTGFLDTANMSENWTKIVDYKDKSKWICKKCKRNFGGLNPPGRHSCGARRKEQRTPNGNNFEPLGMIPGSIEDTPHTSRAMNNGSDDTPRTSRNEDGANDGVREGAESGLSNF